MDVQRRASLAAIIVGIFLTATRRAVSETEALEDESAGVGSSEGFVAEARRAPKATQHLMKRRWWSYRRRHLERCR